MTASMETTQIPGHEDVAQTLYGCPKTEDASHLLIQEITHRINNEYAFVVSAITLRAMRSRNDQVKAALDEAVEILMSMAYLHRCLAFPSAATVEMGGYLNDLCQAICNARLKERGISLFLHVEGDLLLSSEYCWKIGLAVSELITNSAKHAFGPAGGQIRVEFEGGPSTLRCCVRDNGAKRETAPAGQGLLLIQCLTQSIGGSFEWVIGDLGATSVISIPRAKSVSEFN